MLHFGARPPGRRASPFLVRQVASPDPLSRDVVDQLAVLPVHWHRKPEPLFFIIVVALGFCAPFVMVVFDVVLLFGNYDIRQKALDIIVFRSGDLCHTDADAALQNLSRFGPRTTYWSILLLGGGAVRWDG